MYFGNLQIARMSLAFFKNGSLVSLCGYSTTGQLSSQSVCQRRVRESVIEKLKTKSAFLQTPLVHQERWKIYH